MVFYAFSYFDHPAESRVSGSRDYSKQLHTLIGIGQIFHTLLFNSFFSPLRSRTGFDFALEFRLRLSLCSCPWAWLSMAIGPRTIFMLSTKMVRGDATGLGPIVTSSRRQLVDDNSSSFLEMS